MTRDIVIGHRYHMTITKEYLARLVREDGAATVLADWKGTDSEAVEAILAGPPVRPIGPCDNWDRDTGDCLGHEDA